MTRIHNIEGELYCQDCAASAYASAAQAILYRAAKIELELAEEKARIFHHEHGG